MHLQSGKSFKPYVKQAHKTTLPGTLKVLGKLLWDWETWLFKKKNIKNILFLSPLGFPSWVRCYPPMQTGGSRFNVS